MNLDSRWVAAYGWLLALCLSMISACGKAPSDTSTGGSGDAGGSDCSGLPQCEFQCPDGTINPVDTNGCTHTCECVMRNCANEPGQPRDGCVPPATNSGSTDCSRIPACGFPCPDGTINPVDENGCTHSCECVKAVEHDSENGPVART